MRGGWSWYTGAAGWLYRAVLECVLGVRIRHDRIAFSPCLPDGWAHFDLTITAGQEQYEVRVQNGGGGREIANLTLDGRPVSGAEIPRTATGALQRPARESVAQPSPQ